jgi:aspartate kinase
MKIAYNISSHDGIIPNKDNDYLVQWINKKISILWIWEIISAEIQSMIINNLKINWLHAETVELNHITNTINSNDNENIIFQKISKEISNKVISIIEKWYVAIVPWYISWFENGIENTIWRWYSDATASMTAVWLSNSYNVTLEIQKSVQWMLSADPRIVKKNTKLIENIDYLTAKEITWVRWAQAKLLHSQVLRKELQESWIKVHLFDPFQNTKWTIISKNKSKISSWVEYIWWRDNITVFSVSSWDMNSKWILSEISLIANEYASIDIVSTSETEISFTIDWELNDKKLEELSNKIRKSLNISEDWYENFVKYHKNKALVFCIGQNLSNNLWSLWKAATTLSKWWINIEMVSQWTMERAIIFWIEWKNLNKAINLLHEEFIK